MAKKDILKANDARIKLGETKKSKSKVTKRGSTQVQNAIDELSREERKEKHRVRRRYALFLKNKNLNKAEKKEIKIYKKTEIKKLHFDYTKKQALVYASSQNQELPNDLSLKDYSRITDRAFLPQYSRGEEIFSAVAHFAGGGLALAMLIIGIVIAAIYPGITNRPLAIGGMFIFGFSAIVLYTISSIYHFLWINKAKKVFRIIDHSSVYILIAGSYTPFCMFGVLNHSYSAQDNMWGWILLGVEWGFGIMLIVFNCLWLKSKFILTISITGYIVLGWGIAVFFPQLLINMGEPALACLLAGGIVYTVGAIMFGTGPKIKYMHGVSHIMYDFGTILHFIALCFLLTGVGNPTNLLIR